MRCKSEGSAGLGEVDGETERRRGATTPGGRAERTESRSSVVRSVGSARKR